MLCASAIGMSMLALAGQSARAQSTSGAGGSTSQLSEVVVTGSHIPGPAATSTLPIEVISGVDLAARGFTNVAQAINELPIAGVGVTPVASEQTFGRNYANLLSLGPNRTLTLVNGQRVVGANAASPFTNVDPGGEVDLNSIPTALIDRIEVVQAGGGVTYGSDAIAGVVNVILKTDFEGLSLDLQTGQSGRGDDWTPNASLTLGHNFLDGRANFTLSAQFTSNPSLLNSARPQTAADYAFAANPANRTSSDGVPASILIANSRVPETTFGGVPFRTTSFSPLAIITIPDPNNPGQRIQAQFAPGGNLVPYNIGTYRQPGTASGGDGLNTADFSSLQSAVDRRMLTATGHVDLTPKVRLTGEAEVSDVTSTDPANQPVFNIPLFAPPNFSVPISVNNPFLSAQAHSLLAAQGISAFFLSRASTDLTPDTTVHSEERTRRLVIGLDGDLDPANRHYHWSVSANYGRSEGSFWEWDVLQSRFNQAVNAVVNPATGAVVCRSTLTNPTDGCVPLNLFGAGAPSAAARAYISGIYGADYAQTQTDYQANFGGELAQLPAGEAKFSIGYEYRREDASFSPDANALGGLTRSVAIQPTSGAYDTSEGYVEIKVPVISPDLKVPLVNRLDLEGSYRLVDNSRSGQDRAWTYGLRWKPVADLTVRASKSRSFRAPALTELYLPQQSGFLSGSDPCDARNIGSGPNPGARTANCRAALTALGLPANFNLSSSIQNLGIIGSTGGNANLKNEVSDSWTIGATYQPRQVKGLSLSFDKVQVNIAQAIDTLTVSQLLSACYDSPSPTAGVCSQFTRNASGQIASISTGYVNAGYTKMDGESISIQQVFALRRDASLRIGLDAFHLDRLDTSISGGGFDVVKQAGEIGTPHWKGSLHVAYDQARFGAQWTLDYLGESTFDNTATVETQDILKVKAYALNDLSAYYRVRPNVVVRAGVNNLFDVLPPYPLPVAGSGPASGGVYDQIGRFWFVGLNLKL